LISRLKYLLKEKLKRSSDLTMSDNKHKSLTERALQIPKQTSNVLRSALSLRKSLILCLLVSLSLSAAPLGMSQASQPDYRNRRLSVERRAADLLKRMTLDEKVAQMVCLWSRKPQNVTNPVISHFLIAAISPQTRLDL
jgi:hypothetical protein